MSEQTKSSRLQFHLSTLILGVICIGIISYFCVQAWDRSSQNVQSTDSPIVVAAKLGDLRAVEVLLGKALNADKEQALRWSILNSHSSVFFKMYEAGIRLPDFELLVCCCSRGTEQSATILRYLLQKGVAPNQDVFEGCSPLNMAVNNGFSQLVDVLLEFGADPHRKDQRGQDAFDVVDSQIAFIKAPNSIWRKEARPSNAEIDKALKREEEMKERLSKSVVRSAAKNFDH